MMQQVFGGGTSRRALVNPRLATSSTANLSPAEQAAIMNPSDVDVVFVTFNAAKNIIEPQIFGEHLARAFRENASGLPDLVVFSLQEVAPLPYAYIGSYFLAPYLCAFEGAMNIAAASFVDTLNHDPPPPRKPYSLVKSANVGMTAIMLFALDPHSIENLKVAETSFGRYNIGNKGAVGLRFMYSPISDGDERKETELTFVAAHLAAMEWHLEKRNLNWTTIMDSLLWDDPGIVLPEPAPETTSLQPSREEEPLLRDDEENDASPDPVRDQMETLEPAVRSRLHDSTIYKPSSHLFVAGDLNYRISDTTPHPEDQFPSLNPDSDHHHPTFFAERDQLTLERSKGNTLHGLVEANVNFPPTYKYEILADNDTEADECCNTDADGNSGVSWRFASHRWPSWCDRVLYSPVPDWAKSKGDMQVVTYNAMPVMKSSDHRGVFLRIRAPLIKPEDLAPPDQIASSVYTDNETDDMKQNTRLRLPVPVDRDAWATRSIARKTEILTGWTSLPFCTKRSLAALGAGALVAAVGWWAWTYR